MIGKYSPTVSRAYAVNQDWHKEVYDDNGYVTNYDAEGYNRYGYNEYGVDRAGQHENEYAYNDKEGLYEDVQSEWGYDGHKPVCVIVAVATAPKDTVMIEAEKLRQILDALRQVTHTFRDVESSYGQLERDTIEQVYVAITLIPHEVK